jgi:hypothetical protein
MFELGVMDAMRKVASLDQTVDEVVNTAIRAHLPEGKGPDDNDDLETLLPEDGDLEALIQVVEENFDITLPTDTVFALFAEGTVKNLKKAVVKQLVKKSGEKTAAYSHQYYMRNRARERQRSRQYRMRNLHQIRRRSRIYRAQVKRRQRRPRQRVGAPGAGYRFVAR